MSKGTIHNRRDFLRLAGAGAAGLVLGARTMAARQDDQKPNVILILTDDQGTIDVNCFGAEDLYTPNLDALAARGTRFTQFYVGAPVCSPSRAALMTGRCPQRAELPTNAYGERGMPGHQITIAEMLKSAGYRTGIFGKWHLGEMDDQVPLAQGFDEFFGHKLGCIDNYSHYFYWHGPNRHDLWRDNEVVWEEGKYFPDLVVREAHRFLEENQHNPFFMYLPFNVPHYPMQGEEEYREMYADMEMPRQAYAEFVSTIDEKIGAVIDKVDALGLRENTLIVFMSDHGHSTEGRAFFGGGNNGPYRGHKFTLWEGGIRVPCIVSWPGQIPEGAVRGQAATSMDWLPTIAHYCGVSPPGHPIDGTNIADLIASADTESPHGVMCWQLQSQWAVREGDWKLVVNGPASSENGKDLPAEKFFLSNLAEDPGESNNLAGQHAEMVERLTKIHEKWADDVQRQ
jgi:arylsulfatase A-like enzyme